MTSPAGNGNDPIRIGTRGSTLALVQAHWVADQLTALGIPSVLVPVRTAGDDRAPETAWGEGAFVTAIERALLDERVDVAVHSAKDVPTSEDPHLVIAAWTAREDPRDALVCRIRGTTLATLPARARVGTDSPRRGAFLRSVRPDLVIHPLNGNVDTRLRKLDAGESDALVLAVAGLTRLGRADRIDAILPLDVTVPAPGQGALALQARAGDRRTLDTLAALDDPASRVAVEAEREFLRATGGGCRSPIGALGIVDGDRLTLRVAAERVLSLPDGQAVIGGVARLAADGPREQHLDLARDLGRRVASLRTRVRVLVTRPPDGASATIEALTAAGMEAVGVPAIDVRPEPAGAALDGSIASAARAGTWLVATSPTGIRAALAALGRVGIRPEAVRWGVIGRASAAVLEEVAVAPFTASRPLGEVLGAELPVSAGDRVLLVRSDIADPGLVADLAARGAEVVEVIGYRTHEAPDTSRELLVAALADPVDAVAFASGSAVRGLIALAPAGERERLLSTPAVCIGPTTVEAARAAGFSTVAEAGDPSPTALVAALSTTLAATLPSAPLSSGPAGRQGPAEPTSIRIPASAASGESR